MSLLNAYRKKIVLNGLSSAYNFKQLQITEIGDALNGQFVCNEMTFGISMLDNVWKFICVRPSDTSEQRKCYKLRLSNGEIVVLSVSNHLPSDFITTIAALVNKKVSVTNSDLIFGSIFRFLECPPGYLNNLKGNVIESPDKSKTFIVIDNPIEGITRFVLGENVDSLVLYYQLDKDKKKQKVDYRSLLEGLFIYVDFVTDDLSDLKGIL